MEFIRQIPEETQEKTVNKLWEHKVIEKTVYIAKPGISIQGFTPEHTKPLRRMQAIDRLTDQARRTYTNDASLCTVPKGDSYNVSELSERASFTRQ